MGLKLVICLTIFLFGICHGACPSGWKIWGDYCYHFHDITYATSGMSWADARLACKRYGGDLVVIRNSSEQQFLASTQTAAQKQMHYWIGLTDAATEGQWKWVDGTPVAATGSNWRTSSGEPNNWGGNEDCAEMHFDGKWNDNACFREFAFICKKHKDAKVPPAPTLPPLPSSTKDCKPTVLGMLYRGFKNTTKSGRTCQKWSSQSPQAHTLNKPEDHPDAGLVENYCRNPDLEPDGPWCYTTSPGKRWEYCDIPMCSAGPVSCEAGWTGFNGSCYLFARSAETWFEARRDCQDRGGDMTIINSQSEQNFIANQAKLDRQGYWIGLTDRYTEGHFYWVDGTKLNDSIAYWNTNEPSNAFGGEDCVELYSSYSLGKWNDNKCTAKRYYVCEKLAGKSQCPEDWITYNDTCYQLNAHPEQKKTWLEAKAACRSYEGADLVSIHNAQVRAKLTQEIHNVFMQVGYYWIGLSDQDKEETFTWSDKSNVDYTNWGINEIQKNTDALNCVRSELRTVNGFWSVASCNSTTERNYYVCARKREYNRCHSPLGMENFEITDSQITASSQHSPTTPPSSGRRNAVKAFGLDGAWCAATNDQNQWLRIDLGEFYNIGFISLQGHPAAMSYVKSFYLKYSPDGKRWSSYGYQPPQMYKTLPGNTNSDRLTGVTATLSPAIKARFVEIHPLEWANAICMRVEIYGCPAVVDSDSCGKGWMNNTALSTCYKFSMTKLPWAAARANCLLEDGDLLSINSRSEYDFIRSEVYKYRGKTYSFWSGLNDRDYKRVFQWSDGTPVTFIQWYSGNPVDRYYYRKNCAAMRSYYSSFYDVECGNKLPYICKRKLKTKNQPQDRYTGNWISKTDYYWPLNDVSDGEIVGTRSGNISGTFSSGYTSMNRQYLNFDGRSSFLNIPGFLMTCVSDPSLCSNGLTYSFLTYINSSVASRTGKMYLIDILGTDQTDSVGLYVYLENRRLGVYLRSVHHFWHSMASIAFDSWIHVAFTWNEQFGLSIYLNGIKMVTDNSGVRTGSSIKRDRVSNLFIGKSASFSVFAQFSMMSLAIWKRSLSADEVKDIYLAELGKCKVGWVSFGQNCYQFNSKALSWTSAKVNCESQGAQLATVETSIQQAFFTRNMGPDGINSDVFIGLNSRRSSARNVFEWVDGSSVIYANWAPGSPNIGWRREDVTLMRKYYNGAWDDVSYYYSRGFVCQRKKDIFVDGNQNQSAVISRTLNQYHSTTIGCPLGSTLNITSAVWGKSPSCSYKNVLPKLLTLCSRNKYACRVSASTTYYGSHCSARKELKFDYSCVQGDGNADTVGCDAYWSSVQSNNYCYKLYQLKRTWSDARKHCQAKGAELVSIMSRKEELLLTSMLIDSYDLTNIWTGLNDLKVRGSYSWSDSSVVRYTNWYNSQPDDSSRRGSCVKASLQRGYRDMMSWADDDCASKNSFICKKLKASTTTKAPMTTKAYNGSCLPGWSQFGNNCYQFSTVNATWIYARDICLRQKAALASIHSLQENEAVFNFFVNTSLDSAWIGLQDKGIFRGQRWTDGTPVDFTRWDSGQPDSNLGQQSCSVMNNNGFWRDTNCLLSRNYICKAAVGKATAIPTTKKLTPPITPSANLKLCPRGWVWSSVTGDCYMFSSSNYTATWFVARTFCQSKGGQLTSIKSLFENDYLAPFILNFRAKEAWIGLSDLGVESGWEWVDGTPAKYFNWNTGLSEPNDNQGMEDCVVMTNGGQWSDVYCGDKKAFICKRPNNTVPVASTVAPTAGPDKGFCDPGWVHYLEKCYQFNANDKLSWYAARNACRGYMTGNKNGDLVSIHSNYENAFIFSQLKGKTAKMFIGLNDLQYERRFRWSDQSEVTFTNWYTRQPDNNRYREDCTEIWPYSLHKGKWNDVECRLEQGYICQKDASATKPVQPTTGKSDITCPEGYLLYSRNCYAFKKQPMTWDEARDSCKKDDTRSELVSVHNSYESAYVYSRGAEFTSKIWIGLHRPANETKFRWSNNRPYDFSEWFSYPRRRYTHLRSCSYYEFYKTRNGYWRDSNCTVKLPFVCMISNSDEEIKPEHPGNCPTGWLKYDKHCYFVKNSYYGTRNWAAARQLCLDFGADLASIHSELEQTVLYEKLIKGSKSVWIGLNDRRVEQHMVWSDGTPYDYKNWDTKEPNDNQGYENCAEMVLLSGKWNDVSCSSYRGYVCKKELGCDEEFGVKNSSIIKDSQISASSYHLSLYPQYGRLNFRSKAWCAATTDKKPYIQIDLVEKKRVNRILMQGYGSQYVLSFNLLYSDDGSSWQNYMANGRIAILAGNRNSYSTDGVTLDPPVNARFVRISPLTWKYRSCMRLELYGCGYVCNTPLGMEARTIQNGEITASSSMDTHLAYDARLRNPRGQSWCAKTQDEKQWLQIKLSNKPMKISQIATQGTTINGKSYVVEAYKIAYSDDGITWTDYTTYLGEIRIFSGNVYPDTAVFHALTKTVTGSYIRFYPLKWSGKICMRVEVYGCAYECDNPIGIAAGKIPDKAITASSSAEKHEPAQGRLNKGSFNVGSWCAKTADQQQYLELDLGADSRITAIATQGFEGDISKYVTDYRVQFSSDAKFWNSYEVSGVIQLFTGNSNGRTVQTNKLPVPIRSRYLRINPRHWKQGICMRIELSGCALAPVVYPTDAPVTKKRVFKGSMKFSEEKYIDDYKDKTSLSYIKMANRIETAITKVYIENYAFKEGFESVQVTELKPGSVIASFIIIYKTADANATAPLKDAIAKGKLGDFAVDKDSLKLVDVNDKPDSGKSKTTQIVHKEGLSTGGKVALVVIFLMLMIAIVAAGLIYYYKRRGRGQFEHKSFDNPIHYSSDVYSSSGETVSNLPSQD